MPLFCYFILFKENYKYIVWEKFGMYLIITKLFSSGEKLIIRWD